MNCQFSRTVMLREMLFLGILWLFVASVAAFDVYTSIKFQDTLLRDEINPIGRVLIKADDGSVALFMSLKFLGTSIVLSVLPLIYLVHKRVGTIVLLGIAAFQVFLLYCLSQ